MDINEYARLFGNYREGYHSIGLYCLSADRQVTNGTVEVNEIGNAKAFLRDQNTDKWCIVSGGLGNDQAKTLMMGAICGDVAGSVYEWHNIKYCPDKERIVSRNAHFTDDSVMTCAVANGLKNALSQIQADEIVDSKYDSILENEIIKSLVEFGRKYPRAGYGGSFRNWLWSDNHEPYNSWGNGSAMRVSYAGWVAKTLFEAEHFAEVSARVTHNHPEGIKGAKAVAGSIFILRNGGAKSDVLDYVKQYYDLNFTLDDIRDTYHFDVSCQGSVPQALEAFIEGEDFSDVISKAISIGGDSDTIAAIAGSIAEVIYPIPQGFRGRVIDRINNHLRYTLIEAIDFSVLRNNSD